MFKEQSDQFKLILTRDGWRCDGIGDWFQSKCRTPEWKASIIVFSKYKRKMNLEHSHLRNIRTHVCEFSEQRKRNQKPASNEFLIQEASAYCKKQFSNI